MSFTKKYRKILSPFLEGYKTAKNDKARKKVLKNAAQAVKNSRDLQEDKGAELPKELETVCPFSIIPIFHWRPPFQAILRYYQKTTKKAESIKEAESPLPKKIKQSYTLRDVVKEIYGKLIRREIPHETTDKE